MLEIPHNFGSFDEISSSHHIYVWHTWCVLLTRLQAAELALFVDKGGCSRVRTRYKHQQAHQNLCRSDKIQSVQQKHVTRGTSLSMVII